MKTAIIAFVSVFIILMVYQVTGQREESSSKWIDKMTVNDDPDSIEMLSIPNPTDNDDEIQAASESENGGVSFDDDETSEAQDINLKFNHGKGTTLTLTPNGGSAGNTYTRWGRTRCPSGATLVYDGYAAAGWYHQKGNGANYLCMPKDPQYLSSTPIPWPSCLYGAEYETNNKVFTRRTQNYNVPCAVCHVPRSAKIMVPGKVSCPHSWTREYYGYVMTSHMNHWQTLNYECVDYHPQVIPGSASNRNGALFYFLQMECGYGIPCGPYIRRRAITCSICTK